MNEVYAFLAMFAVQILAMSVLFPARLIKCSREAALDISPERLAQLYPGLDHDLASARFFTRIRVGSTAVAVIGLLALAWLFNYMRQPDWSLGTVIAMSTGYFLLQFLPLFLAAWFTYRLYKTNEQASSHGKRTAVLERRGLFDFVPPPVVFLAVLAYVSFVALVLIVQRETFPGFFLIGVLTFVYALQARDVYQALYGKKRFPLDTHTVRANRTGFGVKFSVYICIVNALFFSFVFAIDVLNQKRWVPFAMSVLFVTVAALLSKGIAAMLPKSKLVEVQS